METGFGVGNGMSWCFPVGFADQWSGVLRAPTPWSSPRPHSPTRTRSRAFWAEDNKGCVSGLFSCSGFRPRGALPGESVLPFDRQKNQKSKCAGHGKAASNSFCSLPSHPSHIQQKFKLLFPCSPINEFVFLVVTL